MYGKHNVNTTNLWNILHHIPYSSQKYAREFWNLCGIKPVIMKRSQRGLPLGDSPVTSPAEHSYRHVSGVLETDECCRDNEASSPMDDRDIIDRSTDIDKFFNDITAHLSLPYVIS
jgi:hypothetical protein